MNIRKVSIDKDLGRESRSYVITLLNVNIQKWHTLYLANQIK